MNKVDYIMFRPCLHFHLAAHTSASDLAFDWHCALQRILPTCTNLRVTVNNGK